ncbi:MAG: orotate phosphoribosyltransferase [Ignavibacteria bacterium]|nr:orotate phosphoribosyltransferase [Ignavibacteria bacterium]
MTNQEKLQIFRETGALLEGHFLLSSGLHSDVYFQCAKVLQYPKYSTFFCDEIAKHFSKVEIDVVISPALGGILVGQEVARLMDKKSIFTERVENLMTLRRGFEILHGEKVLICEDVVTTAKSSKEVAAVVEKFGGKVVGLGSIVDRSSDSLQLDYNFFSTIKISAKTYDANSCPLCESKIAIEKPGSRKIG